MKRLFYRIVGTDLTFNAATGRYETGLVDLYDNSVYRNFSAVRSTYGLGAGTHTWIGLNRANGTPLTTEEIKNPTGTFVTDSGLVEGGRFIDTSGSIDLISLRTEGSAPSYYLYNSDMNDDTAPWIEWEVSGPFTPADQDLIPDASRNLIVSFVMNSVPADFEALLLVEIGRPVMAPLYRSTRGLLNAFPEWMKLREVSVDDGQPGEAGSLGGKVLNTLAGEWIEEITNEISERDLNRYIDTVDTTLLAWSQVSTVPDRVYSVTGDGTPLALAHSHQELRTLASKHVAYVDYDTSEVYCARLYSELRVNGEIVEQRVHQERNLIDELGLFVDLPRLHLEDNESYRARILDVYRNRGGAGVQAFKLALRRELNLWKYEGATPDSDYKGATPDTVELVDAESDPNYFGADGLPTEAFIALVEQLATTHPMTWGYFAWNQALWDPAGVDNEGFAVLPYRMDQDQPESSLIQPGVGDGEDLFVFEPDVITGPRDFNANLKLRGRRSSSRLEYRPVRLDTTIQGKGTKLVYDHPQKTVWFTAEAHLVGGGTLVHSFRMSAKSDAKGGVATPNSYDTYELFSDTSTREDIDFVNPTNNVPYQTLLTRPATEFSEARPYEAGVIPIGEISHIIIIQGQWVAGQYQNLETQDHFRTWLSHEPTTTLQLNTLPASRPRVTFDGVDDPEPFVVMESLNTVAPTSVTWRSDPQTFQIEMNDLEPYTSPVSEIVIMPTILWDPDVTGREIELQVTSVNPYNIEQTEYGGLSTNGEDQMTFVPLRNIAVNGSTTWTIGGSKSFPTTTENVVFSTEVNTVDGGTPSTTTFDATHNGGTP